MDVQSQGAPAPAPAAPAAPQNDSIDSAVDEILGINADSVSEEEAPKEEKKEQPKTTKKKFKLKVDDKEFEDELDLNDEQEVIKRLQKAKAFEGRSQEHANLKKQVGMLMKQLQESPLELLTELGLNPEDYIEKYVNNKIETLKKTPEQVKQEEMEQELSKLKKEKEDMEKQAYESKLEQLRDHYANEIQNDILTSLDSGETMLPKSPLVIKRIAETMKLAIDQGYTEIKAKDVLKIVENDFKQELQDMFGKLPEAVLEELMKPQFDRMRKHRLKNKSKSTETARQVVKDTGKMSDKKEKEGEKKSYKKLFSLMD
jgi:hypothetical protein